jgi:hypothetical protein
VFGKPRPSAPPLATRGGHPLAGHGPGEGKREFPGAAPCVIGASTARVVTGWFGGPETEDGTQLGRFRDDATAGAGRCARRGLCFRVVAGRRGDDLEHGIPDSGAKTCTVHAGFLARTSKLSTWSRLQTYEIEHEHGLQGRPNRAASKEATNGWRPIGFPGKSTYRVPRHVKQNLIDFLQSKGENPYCEEVAVRAKGQLHLFPVQRYPKPASSVGPRIVRVAWQIGQRLRCASLWPGDPVPEQLARSDQRNHEVSPVGAHGEAVRVRDAGLQHGDAVRARVVFHEAAGRVPGVSTLDRLLRD